MSSERFAKLRYEDFKALARDPRLSPHEKIGFPDSYREGKEAAILADLRRKLPALDDKRRTVVDIGSGCGRLAEALIAHCDAQEHDLTLVDSAEVLESLPGSARARAVAGRFPQESGPALADRRGTAHAVIVYSVFQYVYADSNPFEFVDSALGLLAEGGALLLGDIPNASQRRRFLASEAGRDFHRRFMQTDRDPEVAFSRLEPGAIDDAVVLGLLSRCRSAGFHAYVVPQAPELPMANRREDILVLRP